MTERQELGSLEAMLFAHAEPVETARLADALRLDADEVTTLLQKLQKRYDEQESGMVILYFEPDRWQMTTRPYYGEMVKRILDTRRNAPLSPAALEVLAVIAYNQPVSRSFIEQVRGVDSSSTVTKLLDKGLIEEAGRLDLPGKPVAFQVTDTFLRVFGLGSLADLPPLHGEAAESAEPEEQPHEKEEKTERDLRGEAEAYFAKHPGYLGGQMPTAVLNAWLGGTGLGEAFAEYERGKSRAETRKLQRENQVLRQNAAAAMRAPVRGLGGGGDTKQEPEDPFLMGFNDEKW